MKRTNRDHAGALAAGLLLNHPKGATSTPETLWWWPFTGSVLAVWIPTLVLAAVFFNIVDFTILGPRLSNHLDWRGALLIGLVCGLASGPVTDAITQLPGISVQSDQAGTGPSPSDSSSAPPGSAPSLGPSGTSSAVPPSMPSTSPTTVPPAAASSPAAPAAPTP